MFEKITYLESGNTKQKRAYKVINDVGIMTSLAEFNPILCGTLPINLDISGSDLDIIMEVYDFEHFEKMARRLFGDRENFKIKRLVIREVPVIKVNFVYDGFEFELFGQPVPVTNQYAYLHMVIEHRLMEQHPHLRVAVIQKKEQGMKTEPAFCKLLGLEGDPYESLLEYGKSLGFTK
ncbi:DUF4269 domain-containing protein [Bacillus suaedae]|uniref:DUF4269 domain-containing protein n=1 Tax=Halalkalibacter suaedae TaxID=2822140 RepID=A0A940WU84_9BACI|nr:DUF4269 domain-containing protein [Bacillus suaedae]MBP3951848.1 DUF4269 domain-containing protein [Bacillus suaedae]